MSFNSFQSEVESLPGLEVAVCFMASSCLLKSREHDRLHANVILALGNVLEIISYFFLPKTIRLNPFRQKIWIFPFFGILNSIRSKFFLLFFLKRISFFAISKNKPWQQYLLTLFYSCSGEIIVDHFPTDNEILL